MNSGIGLDKTLGSTDDSAAVLEDISHLMSEVTEFVFGDSISLEDICAIIAVGIMQMHNHSIDQASVDVNESCSGFFVFVDRDQLCQFVPKVKGNFGHFKILVILSATRKGFHKKHIILRFMCNENDPRLSSFGIHSDNSSKCIRVSTEGPNLWSNETEFVVQNLNACFIFVDVSSLVEHGYDEINNGLKQVVIEKRVKGSVNQRGSGNLSDRQFREPGS